MLKYIQRTAVYYILYPQLISHRNANTFGQITYQVQDSIAYFGVYKVIWAIGATHQVSEDVLNKWGIPFLCSLKCAFDWLVHCSPHSPSWTVFMVSWRRSSSLSQVCDTFSDAALQCHSLSSSSCIIHQNCYFHEISPHNTFSAFWTAVLCCSPTFQLKYEPVRPRLANTTVLKFPFHSNRGEFA